MLVITASSQAMLVREMLADRIGEPTTVIREAIEAFGGTQIHGDSRVSVFRFHDKSFLVVQWSSPKATLSPTLREYQENAD